MRNSIIYIVSQVLNSSVSFLLLPFITNRISPEQYGSLAIFNVLLSLFKTVILFGVSTLASKKYFEVNHKIFSRFLGNGVRVMAIIFSLFSFLVFVFLSVFKIDFDISSTIIYLALFSAFADSISALYLTILQMLKEAIRYAFVSLIMLSSSLVISITLIVYFIPSHFGRIIGIIIPLLFVSIYSFLELNRRYDIIRWFSFKKQTGYIIILGGPLVISQISGWALDSMDRLMLNKLVGLGDTGIYSAGYAIGSIILFIQFGISRAWAPYFYESLAKNHIAQLVNVIIYYFIGMTLIALLLSVLNPVIFLLINDQYQSGLIVSEIVLASYFVNSFFMIFVSFFIKYEKNKTIAIIVVSEACCNFILNIIFIPKYGFVGAAIGTFGSLLLGLFLTFFAMNRILSLYDLFFKKELNIINRTSN